MKPLPKITTRWVWFKNIYGLGHGELSFFKNLLHVEFALIIMLWISDYFPELKPVAFVLVGAFIFFYVIASIIGGFVLDTYFKLLDSQHDFHNVRNPAMREILIRLL